ncbi:MAG: hypothetical protein U5M23_08115 [Marinagarivorans sp.]|nr:hypothetical protein [Marinagarivorans sp.]
MTISIADTIRLIEELLPTLDNAYWESSHIERKDTLYDTISIFHIELRELAKLSIEDHYLTFEPVSTGARNISYKLRNIQNQLDSWSLRNSTSEQLRHQLPRIAQALSREL